MNIFDEPTPSQPMQLDVQAIDLAMIEDDEGGQYVILRLIDASGLTLDCPLPRGVAESFGTSLAAYAADTREPAWLA
jgi:hypothetical protein